MARKRSIALLPSPPNMLAIKDQSGPQTVLAALGGSRVQTTLRVWEELKEATLSK